MMPRLRQALWRARVPLLLLVGFLLAFTSLLRDSITFDETSHLTTGMSILRTGDFRLAPDHPPLGKIWAAWPLLLLRTQWPPASMPDWHRSIVWNVGKAWLFRLNRGESFLPLARVMIVLLFLALCLLVHEIARRIFGQEAALLALALAVLCPPLLAHGRLVTTDMPIALAMLFVLLCFARACERLTPGRATLAAASLAAAALTKFSWPLLVAPLLVMAAAAVLRPAPLEVASGRGGRGNQLRNRGERALALAALGVFAVLVTWAAVWTCYGWRYTPFRSADASTAVLVGMPDSTGALPATMDAAWTSVLTDYEGKPMPGFGPGAIRFARKHRLLPEAYLFGAAFTLKSALSRGSYLMGRFYVEGTPAYFPIAFALKTPIPMMALMLAGMAAVATGAARPRRGILFAGLVAFILVYAATSLRSRLNIGHRHLLPLYGPLLILAGASWWWRGRAARSLLGVLLAWLVVSVLWIHPQYLCYFNELAGGPRRGYLYLADSNLDWGQDIKRLASYARRHPDETIKLAYFGSGEPNRYGFPCEMLPSRIPFREPCALDQGTYVVSATQLLGVYDVEFRDEYWEDGGHRDEYRRLSVDCAASAAAAARFDQLKRARLIHGLRHRSPDDRIGYALFVYRLDQAAVDSLVAP